MRATNYFASLFINICRFNNMFLVNNKEINANKTIIYLREIILFAIEKKNFIFKSRFFLFCVRSFTTC